MSFLYPRTIAIYRENRNSTPGAQGYGGISKTQQTVIAQGIEARIQAERQGSTPVAKLPSDAAGQSIWRILFKADKGLVQDLDFIVDDDGLTYQVISACWNPLVTTCICQIMET